MKKPFMFNPLGESGRVFSIFGRRRHNRNQTRLVQARMDSRTKKSLHAWISSEDYREVGQTVEKAADSMGVGVSQLNYYCKKHFGCTFSVFRTRLRIEDAKRFMIECPEMSISAIAEMVGITDKSNFRKQFEQMCGCTPMDWRKRNGRK